MSKHPSSQHKKPQGTWTTHWFTLALILCLWSLPIHMAKASEAEIVLDLRNGDILFERNSTRRLHPASLTKMMTLYIAFEALEQGEIQWNDQIVVSAFAASQPPSSINLREGETISVHDLIVATALRSANDASVALGEAISGTNAEFVARMNRTAQRMGLNNTEFRNAHGLTHNSQLTTARDLARLAWQLHSDHHEHFRLFSQQQGTVRGETVHNTNVRFLRSYPGATGFKTGFTRAAGHNIAATATRNGIPLLVITLRNENSEQRRQQATALLDRGFERAQRQVAHHRPPTLVPDREAFRVVRNTRHNDTVPVALSLPNTDTTQHTTEQGDRTDTSPTTHVVRRGFQTVDIAARGRNQRWTVQHGRHITRFEAEQASLLFSLNNIDLVAGRGGRAVEQGAFWTVQHDNLSLREARTLCQRVAEPSPCNRNPENEPTR